MKILIVGAGLGGLTLAAFLKGSNIEYDIIEKSNDWKQTGYLIGLWNNGRHILQKLGLAEHLDQEGHRIKMYSLKDGQGRVLKEYNLTEFYSSYGMAFTLILRASLHRWLLDSVDSRKVDMGTTIKSISQGPRTVDVVFDSGLEKTYDVVVGADGAHSAVRSLIFGDKFEKYRNWRHWYAWVDKSFAKAGTITEYLEPNEFIVVFDLGEKALVAFLAPRDHTTWDDEEGRMSRLKKLFKDEAVLMPGILENLQSEKITPTDLLEVHLSKWVHNRVVLLGDAAHAFEPHAGLGGSMAMEDAYVLAAELMKISNGKVLAAAFLDYERERKARVALARKLTHRMRMFALIKSKLLRKIVNFFIPVMPVNLFIGAFHRLMRKEL